MNVTFLLWVIIKLTVAKNRLKTGFGHLKYKVLRSRVANI